ncbi:tRNA 4-thiouridine(8) synthase ThiI [Thermodesulfobacteriota bacterium]
MKAISIFSGGLDSMLASTLISSVGIEVQPVFFSTPFFPPDKAKESADHINLPLKIVDITERHFFLLKEPNHGFGGNMNPCIDCHALMIRIAGEMLLEENADFIISGEVLGQRPMSQNRGSLSVVESESGMKGLILRPLSAKLLSATIPELKGWVDRDKLLSISGRSRKPQISLAKKFNISKYPSPAGGCLLTDKVFSKRLKDLLQNNPELDRNQVELLKLGRHFRIAPETKIIVGRNKQENDRILDLAGESNCILHTKNIPGPVVAILGKRGSEIEMLAAAMTASYSDARDEEAEIVLTNNDGGKIIRAYGNEKSSFKKYMI